jgi:hypothetical protein
LTIAEGNVQPAQVFGQDMSGKAWLLLVKVNCEYVEADGRSLAHVEQQVKQSIAVLSARQADHHAVALFDHPEILDARAHTAQQLGLDLTFDKHPA